MTNLHDFAPPSRHGIYYDIKLPLVCPVAVQPWCLVHNSIRNDMRCLAEALDKLVEQLKTGLPLEAWQVSNLQAWLRVHIAFVHHHHETEEGEGSPAQPTHGYLLTAVVIYLQSLTGQSWQPLTIASAS